MSLNLTIYRKRKCTRTLTVTEASGVASVIEGSDTVIARIGRGATTLLTISSAAATANGSSLTAENPSTLVLAADDVDLPGGLYDLDLLVKDSSESNAEKAVERGTLTILEAQ